MRSALQGQVIVIIGGTSGIGLSAAKALLCAGAQLVVLGGDAATSAEAQRALGRDTPVLTGDARHPETPAQAIKEARRQFKDCHGLLHVAGGSGRRFGDGPAHTLSARAVRSTLRLNFDSVVFSNRAALRHFLSRPGGGTIVNVSSVLAYSPSPRFFATHAYAAAKAAVIGFTRSVASHYASEGIRANVLAPGLVDTPMAKRACADLDILRFTKSKQPLDGGRIGRPDDLDAAIVYLLSEAAGFVTGQVLGVDGGWSVTEGQYQ